MPLFWDASALIKRYATDSMILAAFLHHASAAGVTGRPVLVASDARLLRAARSEGFDDIDPVEHHPHAVPALVYGV